MTSCQHFPAKVIDSRPAGVYRTRRYYCSDCNDRWSTIEVRVAATKTGMSIIGKFLAKLAANPKKTILLSKTIKELFHAK